MQMIEPLNLLLINCSILSYKKAYESSYDTLITNEGLKHKNN